MCHLPLYTFPGPVEDWNAGGSRGGSRLPDWAAAPSIVRGRDRPGRPGWGPPTPGPQVSLAALARSRTCVPLLLLERSSLCLPPQKLDLDVGLRGRV